MSKPNWLRVISALLAGVQMVNAGLASIAAHTHPVAVLCVGGVVIFLQVLVNEFSLSTPPSFKPQS